MIKVVRHPTVFVFGLSDIRLIGKQNTVKFCESEDLGKLWDWGST